MGRFFLEFLSSEFIDVVMIQPSYAKANAHIAAIMLPEAPPSGTIFALNASPMLPFLRPTIVPTTPITRSGTNFINVALT